MIRSCFAAAALAAVFAMFAPRAAAQGQEPMRVILETDYGSDADDALALDVVCKLADQGKFNLLGVSLHKLGPRIATAVAGSLAWYGYPSVPVAMSYTPMYHAYGNHYADSVALHRGPDGKLAFPMPRGKRIEGSVEMYRRVLAAQPDASVSIISVGYATNLSQLLDSRPDRYSPLTGVELVAKKVKQLVAMMGYARQNPPLECNIMEDVAAMHHLLDLWPVALVQNPFEIGERVVFNTAEFQQRLGGKPNPLLTANLGLDPKPHDQCQWDVMSVMYVVRPDLFAKSEPGTISIDWQGYNRFTPSPSGRHIYLTASDAQRRELRELILQLISTPPAHKKH